MTSGTSTIRRRFRRLLPAALLAAAASLGGSAVAGSPIAHAAPNTGGEWDIGAYDQCLAGLIGKGLDKEERLNQEALCCINSGGQWSAAREKCEAPPAEPAEGPSSRPLPQGPILTATPVPADPRPAVPLPTVIGPG
jgi:hypothetical protein